jgi:hypothetical protein
LPTSIAAAAAAVVDNGLEYSADEIVVSNGAKQAIWQVRCSTQHRLMMHVTHCFDALQANWQGLGYAVVVTASFGLQLTESSAAVDAFPSIMQHSTQRACIAIQASKCS